MHKIFGLLRRRAVWHRQEVVLVPYVHLFVCLFIRVYKYVRVHRDLRVSLLGVICNIHHCVWRRHRGNSWSLDSLRWNQLSWCASRICVWLECRSLLLLWGCCSLKHCSLVLSSLAQLTCHRARDATGTNQNLLLFAEMFVFRIFFSSLFLYTSGYVLLYVPFFSYICNPTYMIMHFLMLWICYILCNMFARCINIDCKVPVFAC